MFKVIALAFLLATAFAGFHINLEAKEVDDNQFIKKLQGTGQQQVWVSQAATPQTNVDKVYTFSPKVNDKSTRVVFDTTVGRNWEYQAEATPAVNGASTLYAGQGRVTLSKAEENKLEKVTFDDVELKDVSVLKSNTAAAIDNLSFFKQASTVGFALNREYQTNFFETLEKNKVKLEKEGRGFFFYFSEKVNQIFFGLPNTFFAKQSLETIDAKNSANNPEWILPVKAKGISLKGLNPLTYSDPVYATIDSTTRYIWASDSLVDSIVKSLNSQQLNCLDVTPSTPIGIYECDEGSFPRLELQFLTNDSKNQKDSRVYSIHQYTQKLANNKVRLLIRKAGQYQSTTQSGTTVPQTKLNASTELLVLGTVFLEHVYTYFSFEDHTIKLAQAYEVVPQPLGINQTYTLWYLIVGPILMVAALAYILVTLTKVPFSGQTTQKLPSIPQSSVVYQQQPASVIYTSYAPPQQVFVQPQQMSPTRIVQTNTYQPHSSAVHHTHQYIQ